MGVGDYDITKSTQQTEPIWGCMDSSACNYNVEATGQLAGACDYGTECWDGTYQCDPEDCPVEPEDPGTNLYPWDVVSENDYLTVDDVNTLTFDGSTATDMVFCPDGNCVDCGDINPDTGNYYHEDHPDPYGGFHCLYYGWSVFPGGHIPTDGSTGVWTPPRIAAGSDQIFTVQFTVWNRTLEIEDQGGADAVSTVETMNVRVIGTHSQGCGDPLASNYDPAYYDNEFACNDCCDVAIPDFFSCQCYRSPYGDNPMILMDEYNVCPPTTYAECQEYGTFPPCQCIEYLEGEGTVTQPPIAAHLKGIPGLDDEGIW